MGLYKAHLVNPHFHFGLCTVHIEGNLLYYFYIIFEIKDLFICLSVCVCAYACKYVFNCECLNVIA